MDPKSVRQLITIGVISVLGLIGLFTLVGIKKVSGHEAIVRQHMMKGVLRAVNTDGTPRYEDVYRDGTHFFMPGFMWDLFTYDIGRQKMTMDFMTEEQAAPWGSTVNEGAEYPRLQLAVGTGGGQQAWVGGSIVYRIGHRSVEGVPVFAPDLLVQLHISGNGKDYEDVILKRIWQEVVTSNATTHEPLDIYSGAGFEDFRKQIDARLKNHPILSSVGIYVESTILYPVRLDPHYEKEIADKQLAVQTKLKEQELKLAAEATAEKVRALEQANVEIASQKAEALKQAQNKKTEADAYQKRQDAEASRFKNEQEARGVLAMKLAEAEGAQKLTEAMYGGTAGDRRYRVEFAARQAEQLAGMLDGVKVITDKALVQLVEDPTVGTVKATVPVEP